MVFNHTKYNGSYTSTYVHPVTGETVTYTDNMLNVYVIESFVYASDFGTGSLALGGGIGQGGGGGVYDIDKAINWLNSNAHESWKDAKGECAKYIRLALEAGGLSTKGHPVAAWEYSTFLPKLGFIKVNTTNYLKGDIAVIQGYSGGKSDPKTGIPYGHIQMYNGSIWISDFKQYNGFWPGRGYRDNQPPFEIFRWPTYR